MTTEQKFQEIKDNLDNEHDLRVAAKVAMLVQDYALAQRLREYIDTTREQRQVRAGLS